MPQFALEQQQEYKRAAKTAQLKYVNDDTPGISRHRNGTGFRYTLPSGRALHDHEALARIRSLAIPPAWKNVWICPDENGHIQAVGRDQRGRKQYRYHPRWREVRDQNKYEKMVEFASALPKVRRAVRRDLARHGLPREKVLAAIIAVMEKTLVRVGNEEYARNNHSFGLTTMRDKHAAINGQHVRFHFRGKSGKEHDIDFADRRLARIVQRCQDLPGYELFQYVNGDGTLHNVSSTDVNQYLRDVSGEDFTAKDFRTWAGTVLAARALQEFKSFSGKTQAKRNIVQAIESVAKRLGNTRTVCRKCYVHPAILDAYLDGTLTNALAKRAGRELSKPLAKLSSEEAAVLALLKRRLERDSRKS